LPFPFIDLPPPRMSSTPRLHRRPLSGDDLPFVRRLFSTVTREQLMLDRTDFTEEQKQAIVAHQYHAYTSFYTSTYPDRSDSILVLDGADAGRLIVVDMPGEIRLSDIMVAPEFRRRGICTQIMREEIARARSTGAIVTLHVEKTNPALHLYRREGFEEQAGSGSHFVMVHTGAGSTGGAQLNTAS
jgi:ribosomal protein S18 acetylase RimI-like enzyme